MGVSVTSDASGNIIVTGSYITSSITFGSTTLTNAGSEDIFIVKYDGSGNVLWAKSVGGNNSDISSSITADVSGNIIVTGDFQSPSITFGTTTLTNAGSGNIFIVKYDGSGNVLWAKREGGTEDDYGSSVATDASGNIIVTGAFRSSSITFGTTTLTNSSALTHDIFIVKYDGNGNVLWAKSTGGIQNDYGNSVVADASGNIIVTGEFYSSSFTFGTTTLTNAGNIDIFTVKYGSSGNVLWAKGAGGTGIEESASVTRDAIGNIIVTGRFNSSTITFGTTTLTSAGSYDIFIVKYDSTGNVLWAKSEGGTSMEYGYSLTSDANGNIIVTGDFYSPSISFGTTTLTNSSANHDDVFIVKYDGNGNILWANGAGGSSYDFGYCVDTDVNGDIIVTGMFSGPSISFGSTTLTNANMFVVKLNGTTGREENVRAEGSNIFPNPTTGKFAVAGGNTEIEIYNAHGEKIIHSISNSLIDISAQPDGIYFVNVTEGEKQYNQKIVLSK